MKKIIFSLLAVALMVTSCDKDAVDGNDYSSINVAQEADIQSSYSDEDVLNLVNSILDGTYAKAEKGQANLTGKGNDYVSVNVFTKDALSYLTLTDETNDDLCLPADLNAFEMFFDNSAGDGSVLTVEAPEGTVRLSLTGNFAGFFSAPLNSISQAGVSENFNDDNAVVYSGIDFNFTCDTAGVWSDDGTGLWSNPDFGSYRLTPAPFPLVGTLATVVTEATGVDGTLNYAASADGAVRAAIEGSFDN